MRIQKIIAFAVVCLFAMPVFAQTSNVKMKWWNPSKNEFPVLEGQGWSKGLQNFYDRIPVRAENALRKPVWSLSRNSAGLKFRFKTKARQIVVRYIVEKKNFAMLHFPATGVSGVDLYSPNNDGSWAWANGKYKFGDTITYTFSNLDLDTKKYKDGREYHLYLPLYNNVSWLEVGVAENADFLPLAPRKEKPVIVYGTSIAQGGCASRPGMAWTAILERKLGIPMINLGFSGNGQLEKELIDLIAEIDASVFVLDCLPNLGGFKPEEVSKRILASVNTLRKKHPKTPIILTDNAGFIENRMDAAVRRTVTTSNQTSAAAYQQLVKAGIKDIYQLSTQEIGLGTDGTVDGSHPTDLGMLRYATAYETLIKKILGTK
ncbi:MAG: SGNH/GDSL hydrolase family protein [Pedobacter sp.]|uniref:SGNH/GDSL hydrolase family protein n=1 Tax=Pedobacter sp. TaxID=1411316 RepID=UPI0035617BA0